jgi:hypothetical protein
MKKIVVLFSIAASIAAFAFPASAAKLSRTTAANKCSICISYGEACCARRRTMEECKICAAQYYGTKAEADNVCRANWRQCQ